MKTERKSRNTGIETPMLALLRQCTPEQRDWLAKEAQTDVNYLYAIAGCHRKKISVQLACRIEDASKRLNAASQRAGEYPAKQIVTARQLSTMCAVAGFDDAGV